MQEFINENIVDTRIINEYVESCEGEIVYLEELISELEDEIINCDDVELKEKLNKKIEQYRENIENIEKELAPYRELNSNGKYNFTKWGYGVKLIKDEFFVEYIKNLLEETDWQLDENLVLNQDRNWDDIAETLKKYHYIAIHFGGNIYWTENVK